MFEQKFAFSIVVFCSHAAISLWFLLFFQFFGSDFFLNGFSNPFIVRFRSSFLVNENSLNCTSGLVLLCFFYFVVMIFVMTIWRHSHFLSIRSCNFNWIACVTSFFAFSGASFLFMRVIKFLVTLDLPHSQNDFLSLKLTFIYFNSKR